MSNLIPLFLVSLVVFHRPAQFLPTSKPQFLFGKLEKLYLHSSPSPSFEKGGDVRRVLFTVVGFGLVALLAVVGGVFLFDILIRASCDALRG